MTKRTDKPRGSADPPSGDNANVICIPDAIVELRMDVRELRRNFDGLQPAAFRMCAYLLGAFVGGYLLLSAKFDDVDQRFDAVNHKFDAINQKLSELSTVVARIDERTSSASKAEEAPEVDLEPGARSAAAVASVETIEMN